MTVIKGKRVEVDRRLTVEQAQEVTQLFFGEVIGRQSFNRLVSLINIYNSHERGELTWVLMLGRAVYPPTRPSLRQFVASFVSSTTPRPRG
ncbi:hypothetical protein GJ744_005040 [Endocarpon pusillum]|uniref:Uncharacterized protein n=1 Tax=Endocarpon pusillum TaxID=364733 RepID=A0A8H7A571_9EURO|nr:hypothetical protein GJ744_005040 [Endocarpon pusillum]